MKVPTARPGAATLLRPLRPVPATGPARWPALRIAMLAPPWISVPPPGYGGVESVVSVLTEALVERGHDVTLFCAPGSESSATVTTLLRESHPDEIERALYEADHVSRAFAEIDSRRPPFDVVHDHCGFTALAMADRLTTPMVHTVHGPFTGPTGDFYAHHGHKAGLVGISRAQLATRSRSMHGRYRSTSRITSCGWDESPRRRGRTGRSPRRASPVCRWSWPV
jgi:hypothetical protein